MSLAERLVQEPQRENSGETAAERFDYQALWGIALLLKLHYTRADYALAFEFHDDLILLDCESEPTKIQFFQVKTKGRGGWSVLDLTRRKVSQADKQTLSASILGKMYNNYLVFPDHTESLNFVSNADCTFISQEGEEVCLKDCSEADVLKLFEKLQVEYPGAKHSDLALIKFIKARLDLNDSTGHLAGKVVQFIEEHIGDINYRPGHFLRLIATECRARSKYTLPIRSFSDLIRHKAITRRQFESWIDTVREQHCVPDWSKFQADLRLPAIEKRKVHAEWEKYRAAALDPSNAGIGVIRGRIREEIDKHDQADTDLELAPLLHQICEDIQDVATEHMTPFNLHKLKAMILYELQVLDSTRKIQTVDSQPAE